MKTAAIISIGNELLSGRTLDTNTKFLTENLLELSVPTVAVYTVPDDIEKITRACRLAADDADIIIATGGLGPTPDDLTRNAFAAMLNSPLKLQQDLLDKIELYFKSRKINMSPNNKNQACIPKGSTPLPNNLGTAPGILAKKTGKIFAALPGVPSEMKDMFQNSLRPILKQLPKEKIILIKKLNCFGAGESKIANTLGPLLDRDRNPLINITIHFGRITLTINAAADDQNTAQNLLDADIKQIRDKLSTIIFSEDDTTLPQTIGKLLTEKNKTLATAESCTAGLLAKLITDVPGSTAYYTQGWITYSNKSKTQMLNVTEEIIEKHGAVSPQVAAAMAQNAKKLAAADYALAITGIAGPKGSTPDKPIGLVYIALASEDKIKTEKFIFSHDRSFIRERSAQTALNILRLKLISNS
jgi:nicotinamide-nucleotide amidase